MPEPPLQHLLDGGTPTEQDTRALEGVVRRHRRHRATRLRVVAASAVVVLGGALTGIGLSQSRPSTSIAAARSAVSTPSARAPAAKPVHGSPSPRSSNGAQNDSLGPSAKGGQWANGGVTYSPAANSTAAVTNQATSGAAAGFSMSAIAPFPRYICRNLGCGASHALAGFLELTTTRASGVTATTYSVSGAPTFVYGFVRRASTPSVPQGDLSTCARHRELVVRVAVGGRTIGLVVAPESPSTSTFRSVSVASVAVAHGRPIVVAIAGVSGAVKTVTARFSDGSKASARPRRRWVVLIDRPASSKAAISDGVTFVALDDAHGTLASTRVAYPGIVGIGANGRCLLQP